MGRWDLPIGFVRRRRGPMTQNPFDRQAAIPGIRHIVAVASGKGGVGKSTVAANLSVALSQSGAKVGLLDCDIYGPSVPRLFGTLNQKPAVDQKGRIQPIERYGVKLMSIGFLVPEDAGIVWRGPMLFKAVDQFLRDVDWGDLDYLVIDMPPGTGDVQLTLAQKVPISGAITICTPQNLALTDVKRAVDMFHRLNVPVLGMVENMAYYVGPSGEKLDLFPKGEIDAYCDKLKIKKLLGLPFYPALAKASEIGIPLAEQARESAESKSFQSLAQEVRALLPSTLEVT